MGYKKLNSNSHPLGGHICKLSVHDTAKNEALGPVSVSGLNAPRHSVWSCSNFVYQKVGLELIFLAILKKLKKSRSDFRSQMFVSNVSNKLQSVTY